MTFARTDGERMDLSRAAAAGAAAGAAAEAAAKAAADAPGAQAALAPELPKEPGGGAGSRAENAEELPVGPSREAFRRLLADHHQQTATIRDLQIQILKMKLHSRILQQATIL